MITEFTCLCCNKRLTRPYDQDQGAGDVLARPWYRDDSGEKHLAVVCLECGTIHDVSGSFLKGLLSGFKKPYKVNRDINPMELGIAVMDKVKAGEGTARDLVMKYFGMPKQILDILVRRKFLGPAFSGESAPAEGKVKWHIVADYIKPPILIRGKRRQIDVVEGEHYTKIVTLLVAAKDSGWRGGEGFFIVANGDGLVRELESGMGLNAEESEDLVRIIKSNYQDWGADQEIAEFVLLCEEGGFRIYK